ncbi:MAG: acyl--CoA ligase [Halieaceae bacterium]|jgi:long-chain acyl-CoA synthetase|nr:acyl--CoA ligase [Halieaceae bacterium]
MSFTAQDVQQKIVELTADGSPFVLKNFDVEGHTYKGFANAPADLVQLLQAGRAHGDKPFMVYEGRHISFDDFFGQVDILGSRLQNGYGIKRGDRIAIAMRNCPEWAVSFVAAVLAGAIVVPLNSWGKTDELVFGVEDCGASLLICDTQRYALIENEAAVSGLPAIVVEPAEALHRENVISFSDLVAQGSADSFTIAEVEANDPALIMYTSGSTGSPKGVLLRHVSISQALMNMYFLGMLNISLEGAKELPGGAEQETPLLTVPLFHGTGLVSGLLLPLQMGQKVVLMYKWDTETALKLIEEEKITGLTSVPTILQGLFTHPNYDKYDTSSLFRVGAAGAATPEGLPELIESRISKVSRSAGWALTETMSVGTAMSGDIYNLKPEASGVKSPIVELRYVDLDGQPVAEGETGEIQISGITVCAGYWHRPDATTEIMDGPWMRTGDLGMMDSDGFLHITGRIKEIVIRGGENIYPGEIENVAYSMEPVLEVVVFGVPDAKMGEEMAMVAYARPETGLTVDALRAHVGGKLAGYKVPKYIELSEQPLPQNASGKLFKRKIQDAFVAQLGA